MRILILGDGYVGGALARCLSTCYTVTLLKKSQLDYTDRSILFDFITSNEFQQEKIVFNKNELKSAELFNKKKKKSKDQRQNINFNKISRFLIC